MDYFLLVHFNDVSYIIALCSQTTVIASSIHPKIGVSKDFLLHMACLLDSKALTFTDPLFIACTIGPGPFTTLRALLATVNGLSFATRKPLIGLNGLTSLINEYPTIHFKTTIALFNACNNDVYYCISHSQEPLKVGCANIDTFLKDLVAQYGPTIRFIGHGVHIYKEIIKNTIPTAHIPNDFPEFAGLKALAQEAQQLWDDNIVYDQLQPLYLKTLLYKKTNPAI